VEIRPATGNFLDFLPDDPGLLDPIGIKLQGGRVLGIEADKRAFLGRSFHQTFQGDDFVPSPVRFTNLRFFVIPGLFKDDSESFRELRYNHHLLLPELFFKPPAPGDIQPQLIWHIVTLVNKKIWGVFFRLAG
jgi:hypothetical protein